VLLTAFLLLLQSPDTVPGADGRGRPTVTIPRIEAEVTVDGRLDEPVWSQAARLTGFSQYEPVEGRFPFGASGRAMSLNETEGWVKVIGDAKTDKLLGVHMIGPEVTELVAEAALAIEMGATVSDIAQTIHAHPTLPEAVMEAAEAVHQMAVHIFQKPKAQKKPAPASV
jgi:hypothetical protein